MNKALSSTSIVLLSLCTLPAHALNILVSNDDGLTSNVKALYTELKAAGHSVIVSVPCQGQSGKGGAINFLTPLTPLSEACLNNAGQAGDPGAGPVTKAGDGFDYSDFNYVNGTPIMATAYGIDVAAVAEWGAAPDLILSGPNEGQNVGGIVNSSGTVANVQFAAGRGFPAIALSAGVDSEGEEDDEGNHSDNPASVTVAKVSLKLLNELITKAGDGALLPAGLALNVNFPDSEDLTLETPFAYSEIGDYNQYQIRFTADLSTDPVAVSYGLGAYAYPGITLGFNTETPTAAQADDESIVHKSAVSVTAMQVAFDQRPAGQQWLRLRLRDLLDK